MLPLVEILCRGLATCIFMACGMSNQPFTALIDMHGCMVEAFTCKESMSPSVAMQEGTSIGFSISVVDLTAVDLRS